MATLRLKAEKKGRLRFLSHLETVKMVERSLKRAGVALTFSKGFNPHANISFAAPLPVGTASACELVDIEVEAGCDVKALLEEQARYFPQEFRILSARVLDKPVSLMKQVGRSDYRIWPGDEVSEEEVRKQIEAFLGLTEYLVERKTKKGRRQQVDIRGKVHLMRWEPQEQVLELSVDTGSHSNLKPLVVVREVLGWAPEKVLILRTALYRVKEGVVEPIYETDDLSV